ncbi:phage protein [Escherichia coli]|nr:phage protein [Escherichia coli]
MGNLALLTVLLLLMQTVNRISLSVESRTKATRDYALSQLQEAFEAVDPRFFGLFEDEAGVRDLVYEMRGQNTGNAKARKRC